MKNFIALIILLSIGFVALAIPPKPPLGKRWVLNLDFSDEFNGTELDTTKWLDYHPTWKGREPGLFMSSQVSVKDGFMQIRGEKMEKDTIIHAYNRELTFNIKGGAVVSKKSAFLGFYECRMKASKTTLSATFWFSGKGGIGPNQCDKYGLEWDIQECIGRVGNFDGSYFAKGMHSNAHFWYTDCDGKRHDHRAPQVRFEDDELASENFHVYGGWWRDESTASYYYDNGEPKHQKFYDEVMEKPFNKPMYMRLVCETYPFPWIELPTDQELGENSLNTVYYDWVRGYKLVDAAEPSNLKPKDQIEIYDETVMFDTAILELPSSKTVTIPFSYQTNSDRVIKMVLFNPDGKKVKSMVTSAYAGYANLEFPMELDKKMKAEKGYKLVSTLYKNSQLNKSDIIDINTLYINFNN